MDDLLAYMREVVPYWRTVGIELIEAAEGRAVMAVDFRPGHLQNGVMHGGVVASLLDSACACAAISLIFPEAYATSINLQVSYLKPVTGGRLTAQAECLKAGGRILFCQGQARDETGELVATGSSELLKVARRVEGRPP